MASRCKSCGADIIWALTERGKRMPVDPEPVANGNLMLMSSEAGYSVRPAGDRILARRYKSHFATCPQSASHRRAS